ncbi:hypothetical protein HD554DRAFT_2023642, partial [Boletus coccyginus]
VPLVDGYNLPFAITITIGCGIADSLVDLGPDLFSPASLIGPFDLSGFPVGCKGACNANLADDPRWSPLTNSPTCCIGQYHTTATCPSSGVEYYSHSSANCPNSYCHAYDKLSGKVLWTCPSNLNVVYTVTICPFSL